MIIPGELKTLFKGACKRWCFQLEQGEETGYRHFQCRISFGVAKRLSTAVTWCNTHLGVGFGKISPTSNATLAAGDDFYVTKDETRIHGPWSDKDPEEIYVPRRFRNAELKPWQVTLKAMTETEADDRTINVFVEEDGNLGKSFLCGTLATSGKAVYVPMMKEAKDVMSMVLCKPKLGCYLVDLPRAETKVVMKAMFAALETIKNGYAYDPRYKFRDEWFEPPHVWVFTNTKPDAELLSTDRWRYWELRDGVLSEKKWFPVPVPATDTPVPVVKEPVKLKKGWIVWNPPTRESVILN